MKLLSQAQFRDTTWVRDWKPSFVRVGIDVSRPFDTMLSSYRRSMEGMVEFDTDQYFVVAEVGRVTTDRVHDSFSYSMAGQFFRVGIEKNFFKYDTTKNVLSLGLRYARSSFADEIRFIDSSPVFGEREVFRQNSAINAGWWELTSSLKVRLWENLYLGYVVRIQTRKTVNGQEELVPYDIPGFGRNRKNATLDKPTSIGFNYYIYWTIPFREKQVPVKLYR